MPKTEEQLSEAGMVFSAAFRSWGEAIINRVTSIIGVEQVERMKLQDHVAALEKRVRDLEAVLDRRGEPKP